MALGRSPGANPVPPFSILSAGRGFCVSNKASKGAMGGGGLRPSSLQANWTEPGSGVGLMRVRGEAC